MLEYFGEIYRIPNPKEHQILVLNKLTYVTGVPQDSCYIRTPQHITDFGACFDRQLDTGIWRRESADDADNAQPTAGSSCIEPATDEYSVVDSL